jgi:1,4-dihydroxy-2-naphthoate octaprenyltransferase
MRALRLPFIAASVLPFIFGSLIARQGFNFLGFLLGLVAVVATHLGANLINDYADSKSGADWQDKGFYKFFGGSKLIQEGVLSERFYLRLAVLFGVISFVSVIALSASLRSPAPAVYYSAIIFLAWSYSTRPLQFSYRRAGEVIIFLLFGPAVVMGGYFIQARIFPDLRSFLLSLPFGLFTTAILFANEVPDFPEDRKAGKHTWVSVSSPARAFIIYYLIACAGFAAIALCIFLKYLGKGALLSFLFIPLALKAGRIIQRFWHDKIKLMESSKMTIGLQTIISIVLILGLFL